MWNYFTEVKKPESTRPTARPKQSESQAKEKAKEYEKKRARTFLPRWQIGRAWLINGDDGMICTWCTEFKETLIRQNTLYSTKFIDGCTSFKSESIATHESSAAHMLAARCFRSKEKPDSTPATQALKQLNKQYSQKLTLLFRNAHALAKNRKSMRDYTWLCELDEVKGLDPGRTYRNETACRTFTKYISMDGRSQVCDEIAEAKFVSVTSDGATDTSITEQEIIFVRFARRGVPITRYAGLKNPVSPNATGVCQSILDALEDVKLDQDELKKKLVAFGCDGANVMLGKKSGVSALLKRIQPCLITIHCLAHRLELAYKDCLKKNKLYDSSIVLLMGIYYFYHNSPKQRQNLMRTYETLQQNPVIPTRVGGTRWVGHMVLAITNFLKGYKAIRAQVEDCIAQETKGESQNKARGFIKLLKRPDIIGFIHILLDVLRPLHALSKSLQSTETTLAEVDEKITVARSVISAYCKSDGPKVSAFYRETADESSFRDLPMSGNPIKKNLDSSRTALSDALLKSFEKRFADVEQGVVAATKIASFKHWPLNNQKNAQAVNDFGKKELDTICNHFASVLDAAGVETEDVVSEWVLLKSHLYSRYKEKVQELTWQEVYEAYEEGHKNILAVMDLIITIPASSAENERGFSNMKLIKTSSRNKMKTSTLTDLMTIQMCTPSVRDFSADKAIDIWLNASRAPRRPNFKSCEKMRKRPRLEKPSTVAPVLVYENDVNLDNDETDAATDNIPDPEQPVEQNEEPEDEIEEVIFQADQSDDIDEGFESDFENEMTEDEVLKKLREL